MSNNERIAKIEAALEEVGRLTEAAIETTDALEQHRIELVASEVKRDVLVVEAEKLAMRKMNALRAIAADMPRESVVQIENALFERLTSDREKASDLVTQARNAYSDAFAHHCEAIRACNAVWLRFKP